MHISAVEDTYVLVLLINTCDFGNNLQNLYIFYTFILVRTYDIGTGLKVK